MEIQNRRRFPVSIGEWRARLQPRIGKRAYIFRIGQRQEIKRDGLKGDVRTSNFGQGTFLGIVPRFISSRSVELLSGEGAAAPRNILLPTVTGIQTQFAHRDKDRRGTEGWRGRGSEGSWKLSR